MGNQKWWEQMEVREQKTVHLNTNFIALGLFMKTWRTLPSAEKARVLPLRTVIALGYNIQAQVRICTRLLGSSVVKEITIDVGKI